MAALQLQAGLMIAVTIFCAVRTFKDFASGNVAWGVIALLATAAALGALLVPIPSHAVMIDLPR